MDKNLFLAVALSILIYLGWFGLMNRLYPAPAAPAKQSSAIEAVESPASVAPAPTPYAAPESKSAFQGDGLAGAFPYTVGKVELKVQAYGAAIASYRYPGPLGAVELVSTAKPGFFATWPELEFKAAPGPGLVFTAAHPSGASIRKEYSFDPASNLHTLRVEVSNPTRKPLALEPWTVSVGPGLGTVQNELKENADQWRAGLLRPPPQGKTQPVLEEHPTKEDGRWNEQPFRWTGVDNRYFLAALVPAEADFARAWTGSESVSEKLRAPLARAEARALTLAPGQARVYEVPFYFGPKGYTHLSGLGLGFEKSVQFGWFDQIGRFALKVLFRLQRYTHNYGWSIIILTLILQVLMFPLTYKQMKSAAIMKKIQPELAKVQQKFAKDPQRLNQEMMELYRKHGANPLGGCLPILVQMPVFVALFNALRNAWELHGAPWIFWVKDLSAHDPFYVLPLVMGGIMFLQSKMNPVQMADPVQSKMFQYMPVIFTFMFLNFPAGLVLYWLTNSVLGFLTQLALKSRWE
ncbi:MAG TPA: hypothetical protein DCM05_12110 [Elusimicrobia bacterium]|nr:hypothetical protein [Elusimicrobiota bacterium]